MMILKAGDSMSDWRINALIVLRFCRNREAPTSVFCGLGPEDFGPASNSAATTLIHGTRYHLRVLQNIHDERSITTGDDTV